MGEQNSVLEKRGDDYQWDDYESNLDPINSAPDHEPLSFLHNDKYIYTYNLLIHKYKRDIQRMNELRNQLVFLLTAMGFFVSFFLSSAFEILLSGGLISFFGCLLLVFLFSDSLILFGIYYKTITNQCEYPGSKFLDEYKNSFQDVFIDLLEECGQLFKIVQHNSKKNEEVYAYLRTPTLTLIICFFIFFFSYILFRMRVESDILWIILILILVIVLLTSFSSLILSKTEEQQ